MEISKLAGEKVIEYKNQLNSKEQILNLIQKEINDIWVDQQSALAKIQLEHEDELQELENNYEQVQNEMSQQIEGL